MTVETKDLKVRWLWADYIERLNRNAKQNRTANGGSDLIERKVRDCNVFVPVIAHPTLMVACNSSSSTGASVARVPAYSEGLPCYSRKALVVCEFGKGVPWVG